MIYCKKNRHNKIQNNTGRGKRDEFDLGVWCCRTGQTCLFTFFCNMKFFPFLKKEINASQNETTCSIQLKNIKLYLFFSHLAASADVWAWVFRAQLLRSLVVDYLQTSLRGLIARARIDWACTCQDRFAAEGLTCSWSCVLAAVGREKFLCCALATSRPLKFLTAATVWEEVS